MWCLADWTEGSAYACAGTAHTHHANSATHAGRIAICGIPYIIKIDTSGV